MYIDKKNFWQFQENNLQNKLYFFVMILDSLDVIILYCSIIVTSNLKLSTIKCSLYLYFSYWFHTKGRNTKRMFVHARASHKSNKDVIWNVFFFYYKKDYFKLKSDCLQKILIFIFKKIKKKIIFLHYQQRLPMPCSDKNIIDYFFGVWRKNLIKFNFNPLALYLLSQTELIFSSRLFNPIFSV